jgi:hypothetical protein
MTKRSPILGVIVDPAHPDVAAFLAQHHSSGVLGFIPKGAHLAAPKIAKRKRDPSVVRNTAAAHAEALGAVLQPATGYSSRELEHLAGLSRAQVLAGIRVLQKHGSVFTGGERRFVRYALDQKTADQAAEYARATAPGPRSTAVAPARTATFHGADAQGDQPAERPPVPAANASDDDYEVPTL